MYFFRHILRLRRYISGNLSKSAFFERGKSLWAQISDGRGRRPPTAIGVRKSEWLSWSPCRVVSKYPQCIVWFCHKARVWQIDRQTDGRTDGQNYDSQDLASIAASRGNKNWIRIRSKLWGQYILTKLVPLRPAIEGRPDQAGQRWVIALLYVLNRP